MTTLTVNTPDGAKLTVNREGTGHPLVLISGLGGTAAFWKPVIAALGPGYEILTFDQRGIGSSSRGTAEVSIDQLAQDVVSICDVCGLSRASFLGHSTGGAIAQSLAAKTSGLVERLALSAAWSRPSRYMSAMFEFRLNLLQRDPGAYAESAAILSYAPEWLEENWAVYEHACAQAPVEPRSQDIVAERIRALLAFDGTALLDNIRGRTMVIGADDDMIVPAFLQRDLVRDLPNAELRMLSHGGHFYPVSRTRDFALQVLNWMSTDPWSDL